MPAQREPGAEGDSTAAAGLSDALATLLAELLRTLDGLAWAARRLHPPRAFELQSSLAPLRAPLESALERLQEHRWPPGREADRDRITGAAAAALESLASFVEAPQHPETVFELYRALRRQNAAFALLYPLARDLVPVSQFFLEEPLRSRRALLGRLAEPPRSEVPTGIFNVDNQREQRGGFSLYVPEIYDENRSWPLVVALHGGSGHGGDFLWTWLREARGRGFLLLSPTSLERTWSLFDPQRDAGSLLRMLARVGEHWNVDKEHILLTGISDGGTFSLLCGLHPELPFTHLAPLSGVVAPLAGPLVAGARDKPIYLVHGALDWMFPVEMARNGAAELARLGADVTYREIEDLSHTYAREENGPILEWFDPSLRLAVDDETRQ